MKKIRLHGGPWNGRKITDLGTKIIRMSIAKKWNGNRPAIGSESGIAHYDPTPDRTSAHWSHNEWTGPVAKIINH